MSREVCIHGIGISEIRGCPDCQKRIETYRANELKYFLAEGKIALLERRLNIAEAKYNELLMAVTRKFEGETRHDTALRYINQSELPSCGIAAELKDKNE